MNNYSNNGSHLVGTAKTLGDGGEVLKQERQPQFCSVCGALADVVMYTHGHTTAFYCAEHVPKDRLLKRL